MRVILAILAISACSTTNPKLEVPLVSHHAGFDGKEFNETHPGGGVSVEIAPKTRAGIVAVTKTSIGKPGIYAAVSRDLAEFPVAENTKIVLGASGGVAWYDGLAEASPDWGRDIAPLGAGYLAIDHRGYRLTTGASHIPGEGTVFTLRLSIPIGGSQ